MKRINTLFQKPVSLLITALFLCSLFAAQSVMAKTYRMKIQSSFPRGDIGAEALVVFAEAAKRHSDGQLDISVFFEGEITTQFQVREAVQAGLIDLAQGAGSAYSGIIPVADVEFNLPFAYRVPWKEGWFEKAAEIRKLFHEDGLIDIIREEYAKKGFYYLDISSNGRIPFIASRKPVSTIADMRGFSIRSGGLFMEWQNAMGMKAVQFSGGEAYMALQMGTVDATQWDLSAYSEMGFQEVAPYWIRGQENEHTMVHIIMNMNAWNKLSPHLQQALQKAAVDYWDYVLNAYYKDWQVVLDMRDKGIITEVWWDEKAMAWHHETARKMWDVMSKRDPASAKAIEIIRRWHEKHSR